MCELFIIRLCFMRDGLFWKVLKHNVTLSVLLHAHLIYIIRSYISAAHWTDRIHPLQRIGHFFRVTCYSTKVALEIRKYPGKSEHVSMFHITKNKLFLWTNMISRKVCSHIYGQGSISSVTFTLRSERFRVRIPAGELIHGLILQ